MVSGSFDVYKICMIPGDGIGLEVIPAAKKVLEATGLSFEFTTAEAGWRSFETQGTSVPETTLAQIRACDATLAGAFSSPSRKVEGYVSAIGTMRRKLGLFANLRPARSRPVAGCQQGIDILMVRENTEGLYAGHERRYGDLALAEAVVTKAASARIGQVALAQAAKRRRKLAVIHKANILPLSSGLFLETVLALAKAQPQIDTYDVIVDAAAMRLVRYPESFDVLVTTNLFGDILSDLMAGLVGGLGLAPSANIGAEYALFEPVHGSAPDIAGKGVANPTATFLSAAMMLEYLGEPQAAERVENAVNDALKSGPLTADLGGDASTETFTNAVLGALETQPKP